MRRRSQKSSTPLNQQQEDLARRESQLRDEMQKLERMIQEAPRIAEETSRQQREELLMRATEGGNRLDVSMALQDKRYEENWDPRHRGSLRKERREGRIVFLVLALALSAAIIWLLSHVNF